MTSHNTVLRTLFLLPLLIISSRYPEAMGAGLQVQPAVSELLTEIKSPNPANRARAFEGLMLAPKGAVADLPSVLVDLLEEENRFIETAIRESKGMTSVSDRYGEGYSEYYAQLLGMVQKVNDLQNSRTLNVLANSSYDADSAFARELAAKCGERILTTILQKAKSDLEINRSGAIQMLGTIATSSSKLSQSMVSAIRQSVIAGLSDKAVVVRQAAVKSTGQIGTSDDLPRLLAISRSDPASFPQDRGKSYRYPVREAAQKAIETVNLHRIHGPIEEEVRYLGLVSFRRVQPKRPSEILPNILEQAAPASKISPNLRSRRTARLYHAAPPLTTA